MRNLVCRSLYVHVGLATLLSACGSSSELPYESSAGPSTTDSSSTTGDSSGTDSDSGTSSGSTTMDSVGTDSNTGGSSTGGPDPVMVDCNMPPAGAVGANYDHQFLATGGNGTYAWSATNLPDGVVINPVTGELSGTAAAEGVFDVEVTASSGINPPVEGVQTCSVTIGAGLSVDLSNLGKPCIEAGDDILQFVTGGNGDPVTCSTPGGSGNGKVPAGITVNESTCQIEGSITETRYGTWVFMTRLEQGGAQAWAPYCVSQATQAGGAYTIEVDHEGQMNAPLVPGTGTFAAGQPIAYGPNAGDPVFRVTGGCNGSCFFGFAFGVNGSPFDANTFSLSPSALVTDMNNTAIGFSHEMTVSGPAVSMAFENRPFVLNVALDYCMTDTSGPCSGVTNIKQNGNGNLEYGIIMMPQ